MKCEKCGSSWASTVKMGNCPFCGAVLEEKKPDKFDNIPDVLVYIIDKWGKETLAEQRLVSLVSDLCTGCDNELRLLRIAVQSGAYAELFKADGLPDNEKEQSLLKQAAILHRKYFIDSTWASRALSWLAGCLEWNVSESNTAQTSAPISNAAQKKSTASYTDWSKVEKPEVPGFEFSLTPNGITLDKYTGSDENVTVRSIYSGAQNAGEYCSHCVSPKPSSAGEWVCSVCGAKNTGRFCSECGAMMPEASGKVVCPQCGKEFDSPLKFCDECGAKMPEADGKVVCPQCGKNYDSALKFCYECGYKF